MNLPQFGLIKLFGFLYHLVLHNAKFVAFWWADLTMKINHNGSFLK